MHQKTNTGAFCLTCHRGAFPWWWIGPGELHVAGTFQMDDLGRWLALASGRFHLQRAENSATGLLRGAQCGTWNAMGRDGKVGWMLSKSHHRTGWWGLPTGSVLHTRSCPHSQRHQNWKTASARNYCLREAVLSRNPHQACLGTSTMGLLLLWCWAPGTASTWALEPQKKQVPPWERWQRRGPVVAAWWF